MPRLASRRPWLISLILVTGVGPLATDTYISSLPEVRATLGTTSTVAQLTLTFFIAGMAIGQLLSGPVSDSRGRRGLILASSSMFTLMSLLCAMAPTGPALVVERAFQGLVAAPASPSDGPSSPTGTSEHGPPRRTAPSPPPH